VCVFDPVLDPLTTVVGEVNDDRQFNSTMTAAYPPSRGR
jgi:hypothetical protein